jgi:alpha-glucosidase
MENLSNSSNQNKDWWRGCVIYQVYPRSFQDSNGDGIGDLAGITQRLPYIAALGVDVLWISPIFSSPMKDYGYDVSDYRNIDPMFGTLDDFDSLVKTAHELGIKIMVDLVLSHTSDQHPWFAESRASNDNPHADWYVWADAKPDGTPPNNWLSVFGGPAWHWDTIRQQYYLHNFLVSQPDLNFHCPAVQDALLDVVRFWLERGADGFRLDVVNFFVHDAKLRDNPALPLERRNSSTAPSVNPYNHQEHLYSKTRPENIDFLKRFRALLDSYGACTSLGEVGESQRGLEVLGEYTAGNDRLHMCYSFELMYAKPATPEWIAEVFAGIAQVASPGWPCWAFSNHDVMRFPSRWNLSDAGIRLYATLQVCLRGAVCIYQGDELGLYEADVPYADLQDPYGIEFWPEYKGRDGCRTPMVWAEMAENAGFSHVRPWLPASSQQQMQAVSVQEVNPSSILNHYRAVIALRHKYEALAVGEIEIFIAQGSLLGFVRRSLNTTIACLFNIGDEQMEAALPEGNWRNIGDCVGGREVSPSGALILDGWQYAIAEEKRSDH